jgi:hypothetical protein
MQGIFGLYKGKIVNNQDPKQANRVQIYIPGIAEPSTGWARPKGLFGSAENFGIFGVPPEGSEVLVQFEAGDIDSPWYEIPGPDPDDIPEEVKGIGTKFMISFGDLRMAFQQKPSGLGSCKIYSSKLGDENYIEINGETNSITISSLTDLKLKATGAVEMVGGLVKIQGRNVSPGSKEIGPIIK